MWGRVRIGFDSHIPPVEGIGTLVCFVPASAAIEFESAVGTSALTLTALLGALGLTGTSLFCESRICFSRNRSWRNYGCY